jgi:hypothetical protein
MKIKCPRCKSDLEVDAIGDFVSCSSCSVEFNVEESQKIKSLIENFHPFAESEAYIPPVTDNQNVSKPISVLTMPVRTNEPNYVIVTDIRMNFSSMVEFMVKWVFASIPALIILGMFFGLVAIVLGAFGRK